MGGLNAPVQSKYDKMNDKELNHDETEMSDESSSHDKFLKGAGIAGTIAGLAGCVTEQESTPTATPTKDPSGSGEIPDTTGPGRTQSTETQRKRDQQQVSFTLNGEQTKFKVNPQTPLLSVLRNEANLYGPKFGCGLSQCGACTVLKDGTAIRSCVTPIGSVKGAEILTTSGLGTKDDLHPLQEAFIEEQAAQCGYCISGMIMKSKELLDQNSNPSESEIKSHLDGFLCRCGTHSRILRAVKLVSENMEGG